MDFPRNVYHSPGKFSGPKGNSFDLVSVATEDEYDRYIEAGYFSSVPESFEHRGEPISDVQEKPRRGRPPKVE